MALSHGTICFYKIKLGIFLEFWFLTLLRRKFRNFTYNSRRLRSSKEKLLSVLNCSEFVNRLGLSFVCQRLFPDKFVNNK